MLRTALKLAVVVAVLGLAVQKADAFGHCRWGGCRYGCGYAGWGYGGWGYTGFGYGSWGYGGWGYGGYRPVVVGPYLANATPRTPTPALRSTGSVASDNAMLSVDVPADAQVFVNDHATTSRGQRRTYLSRGLKPGAHYTYKIRAEFTRDGKVVTEEQTVQLTAGQTRAVVFSDRPQEQVATSAAAPAPAHAVAGRDAGSGQA